MERQIAETPKHKITKTRNAWKINKLKNNKVKKLETLMLGSPKNVLPDYQQ